MSDLRNPNGFNSAPMAPDEIRDEIRATEIGFGEQHTMIDNGGLSGFHHFEEEEEGSGKAKMIGGGLVVALLLGAASFYAFSGSGSAPVAMKAPASQVASNAPIQTAPAPVTPPAAMPAPDVAANMPATSGTATKSPYDAAPVAKAPASNTASIAPDVKADKPVKSASKSKDGSALNKVESEQTAQLNSAADRATKNGSVAVPLPATPDVATNAPAPSSDAAVATGLPTPPPPPASSVASNGQLVPQPGNTAQDIPAVTPEQPTAPQPEQAAQPQ
jgi:hypothetical protein